jgi:hypothetical protein
MEGLSEKGREFLPCIDYFFTVRLVYHVVLLPSGCVHFYIYFFACIWIFSSVLFPLHFCNGLFLTYADLYVYNIYSHVSIMLSPTCYSITVTCCLQQAGHSVTRVLRIFGTQQDHRTKNGHMADLTVFWLPLLLSHLTVLVISLMYSTTGQMAQ